MKYIVFLSILLASFSIIGCKEKRVRYFQYEIVNNESICSDPRQYRGQPAPLNF